jgi:galactose mutarotase-like enzyme
MITQISNGLVTARIDHKGAELVSLFNHAVGLEYMWQADPKFWPKTSPVLFPVVGALKNNSVLYNDKFYNLPRHGFARDYVFDLTEKEPAKAVFVLTNSTETTLQYPFKFELKIIYSLDQFSLKVRYEVFNPMEAELLFSLGAHPAFRVPLVDGTAYDDYYLKFQVQETSDRWLISKDGLIESPSQPFLKNQDRLPLKRELFYQDALVLKDLKSSCIMMRSEKHTHGIDFAFEGFPFFGIWAFKNADFVCLEPWCGIADSVNHDQRLDRKEGIINLSGGETWVRTWTVKCY